MKNSVESSMHEFECLNCHYKTTRKQSFDIHCRSKKHAVNSDPVLKQQAVEEKSFECKKCNYTTSRKTHFFFMDILVRI